MHRQTTTPMNDAKYPYAHSATQDSRLPQGNGLGPPGGSYTAGDARFKGQVLGGSYRLQSPIGEGGMASVWLAEHTRTQGKLAVKIIHARLLASPSAAQRFALEARHTASLHHPNVVRVFDYGHDPRLGLLYQVMEYVPGESLGRVLQREGPMAWTRVVPIVEQVLAALSAAHESERCLIHRDIKPANILLADHEGQQTESVKVVDFGISRALVDVTSTHKATRVGTVIGSPSTMAPEQWQRKPVSPATDLYALGCTVYAMLAGQNPFQGSLVQMGFQHSHASPRSLHELAAEGTSEPWVPWSGVGLNPWPIKRRASRASRAV
ncbi:MAG: serine/threonine-protein kinase [Myxococcota bacterium]